MTTKTSEAPELRGNVILHGEDALLFIRISHALDAQKNTTHKRADVLRAAVRCLGEQLSLTSK